MVDPLGFVGDALFGEDSEDGSIETNLNPFDALGQGIQTAATFGRAGDALDFGSLFTGQDLYSGTSLSSLEAKLGWGAAALFGISGVAMIKGNFPGGRPPTADYADMRVESHTRLGQTGLELDSDPTRTMADVYGSVNRTALERQTIRDAGGTPIGNMWKPEKDWVDGMASELDAEAQVFTSSRQANQLLNIPNDEYMAPAYIAGVMLGDKANDVDAVERLLGFQAGMIDRYSGMRSHSGKMLRLGPGEQGVYRQAALAYEFNRFDYAITTSGLVTGKDSTKVRTAWNKLKDGGELTEKQTNLLADEMMKFAAGAEGIGHAELRIDNPLIYASKYDMDSGILEKGYVTWDSKPMTDVDSDDMMDRIVGAMKVHPAQLVEQMSLNLEDMFNKYVKPASVAAHRNWYQTEGRKIVAAADAYGMDARMLTQVAAILSPGENWDTNIQTAATAIEAIRAGERDFLKIQRRMLDQGLNSASADNVVKILLAMDHKTPNTMWQTGYTGLERIDEAQAAAKKIGWKEIERITGVGEKKFISDKGLTLQNVGKLWDAGYSGEDLIHLRRLSPPNQAQKTIAFDQGLTFSSDLELDIQREAFENMLFGIIGLEDARYAVPVVADRQSFKTAIGFSMNPGSQLDGVVYDQVAQSHRLAAMRLSQEHGVDMLPEELQAVLWSVWRHLSGGDPSMLYPELNRFDGDILQPGTRFPRERPPNTKMPYKGNDDLPVGVAREVLPTYGPGAPNIIPAGWVKGKGPQVVTNDRLYKVFSQHSMNNGIPIQGSLASLPTELRKIKIDDYETMRGYRKTKDPSRVRTVEGFALTDNIDGSTSVLGKGFIDPGSTRGVYGTKFRDKQNRQVFFPRRADRVISVDDFLENLEDSTRLLDDTTMQGTVRARKYPRVSRAAYFAGQPGWYMRVAPLEKLPTGGSHTQAAQRFEQAMTEAGIKFTAHGSETLTHEDVSKSFYRLEDLPPGASDPLSDADIDKMRKAGTLRETPPPGVSNAEMRRSWQSVSTPKKRVDYWYEFATAEDQKKVNALLERDAVAHKQRKLEIQTATERGEPIPDNLPLDIQDRPMAGRAVNQVTNRFMSKFSDRPNDRLSDDLYSLSATYRDTKATERAKTAFDKLGDDDYVWVFHGTTPENLQALKSNPRVQVPEDYVSDLPTRDARHMYVAPTAADAANYGDSVVAFRVRKSDMRASSESRGKSLTAAFYDSSTGAVVPPGLDLKDMRVIKETGADSLGFEGPVGDLLYPGARGADSAPQIAVPGTTPLPPGTRRAYHYTSAENLDSIRKDGLTMGRARGTDGEPKGVWLSGKANEWGEPEGVQGKILVEVAIPEDTPIPVGGFDQTFALNQDVPPGQILKIHEDWHSRYRYFQEEDLFAQVRAGEYDHLIDMPTYRQAIQAIKDPGFVDTDAFNTRMADLVQEIEAQGITIVTDGRRKSTPYKNAAEAFDDINNNRRIVVPKQDANFHAAYTFYGLAGAKGVDQVWNPDQVAFAQMARQLDDNDLRVLEQKIPMRDQLLDTDAGRWTDDRPRLVDNIFGEPVTDRQYLGNGMQDAPPGTVAVYEHHFVDEKGQFMTVNSMTGDANDPNTYVTFVADGGTRNEMKGLLEPDATRLLDSGTGGHIVKANVGTGNSLVWDNRSMIETRPDWQIVPPEGVVDRIFDLQMVNPKGVQKDGPDHVWMMINTEPGIGGTSAPLVYLMPTAKSPIPATPPGAVAIRIGRSETKMPEGTTPYVLDLYEQEAKKFGMQTNSIGVLK